MSVPTMKTPLPGIGSNGSATAGAADATAARHAAETVDSRRSRRISLPSRWLPPNSLGTKHPPGLGHQTAKLLDVAHVLTAISGERVHQHRGHARIGVRRKALLDI